MVGNIANFNDCDILRTFLLIGEPVSRKELADELELGEGTIRSILDILKNDKLIFSTRQGHSLTKKGNASLKTPKRFIEINRKIELDLYKNLRKAAVLVKGLDLDDIKINASLRDIAIKNNAESALIFIYNEGLVLPNAEEYTFSFESLNNAFNFKNNDILIVTFADSFRTAENSALAVALSLTPKLNKMFINNMS